jgi:hypothetical protein
MPCSSGNFMIPYMLNTHTTIEQGNIKRGSTIRIGLVVDISFASSLQSPYAGFTVTVVDSE